METREEQVWKRNDRLANKTGARSTIFWVKKDRGGERSRRLGDNRSQPKFASGAKYAGDWLNNKKHGYGTQTWSSGDKYEGDWNNNRMHGKGTFWAKHRGKLRKQYTGDWRDSMRHGLGIFFYRDGGKYEGEWVENRRHGRGKMIYPNGDVYEGDWRNDCRDGPGVLSLVSGDRYEGHWREGKKEGTGRYFYFATNKMYEGEWVADVAKCGVYMDTPPELSDYQAHEGDELPPDAFTLPQLGLQDAALVFVDAVTAVRRLRDARDEDAAREFAEGSFSEDEMEQLRLAFRHGDPEGVGEVLGRHLGVVLAHLGIEANDEDLEMLMVEMGVEPEGAISFATFASHMARLKA